MSMHEIRAKATPTAAERELIEKLAKYEAGIREVENLARGIVPCNDFWRGDIDGLNTAVEIIRRALR